MDDFHLFELMAVTQAKRMIEVVVSWNGYLLLFNVTKLYALSGAFHIDIVSAAVCMYREFSKEMLLLKKVCRCSHLTLTVACIARPYSCCGGMQCTG
jgi:hypothetical protein